MAATVVVRPTRGPARPSPRRRRPVRRRPGMSPGAQRLLAAGIGIVVLAAAGHTAVPTAPGVPARTAPAPMQGRTGTCTVPDPTTDGCLTATTARGLAEIGRVFGGYRHGPTVLSAGCWDAHAWNPTSDHPKGRACDLFIAPAGTFPTGGPLARGWDLARWLRADAGPLRVRYVIWQGRIWQADIDRDSGGWGTRYSGGGVYNPADATGGHYDHIHVSFQA